MGEDEVKKLAANLFSKKLAHSMYDAMEKAKSILNIKSQKDIGEDLDFSMGRDISKGINEQKNEQPQDEKFTEELKELESMDASAQTGSEEQGAQGPAQAQSVQKYDTKYGFEMPDAAAKNEELTLNELMQQANLDLAEIEAAEKAKLEKIKQETEIIKEDLREAEQNPEQSPEIIEQVKEEISEVREELKELEEEKAKQQQNQEAKEDIEGPEAQDAMAEHETPDEGFEDEDLENKQGENKAA